MSLTQCHRSQMPSSSLHASQNEGARGVKGSRGRGMEVGGENKGKDKGMEERRRRKKGTQGRDGEEGRRKALRREE